MPELSIAVLPGHRARGIGTELLRRALALAARHHAAVSLSVGPHNPARRLYERLGFVAVRTTDEAITMLRNRADGDTLRHPLRD